MNRRSLLALIAAVPLAGCSAIALGSDAYLDDEIEAGSVYEFSADSGDAEVTVELTDAGAAEADDEPVDVDAASIIIRDDGSPVFTESVEEGTEETFETTFDSDGDYEIQLTNGVATVTVEAA